MIDNENPFAAENPFRKIDKKRFQSVDEKKKAKASPKKTAKYEESASSFYSAFVSPEDEGDTRAFMSAVAGVARLGEPDRSKKPKRTPPPLENPVLGNISMTPAKRTATTPAGTGSKTEEPQPASQKEQSSPAAGVFPEDDADFFSAVQDVTPLSGKGRAVAAETPPPVVSIPPARNPLQDFMDGKVEFALAFTDEYVEGHVLGLDLMVVGKLQAGQFSPESHLDLHGMNAQQAFDALVGFLRGAYFKGQRTVLVVPGRGLNSPHGVSILKEKVQNWFTQEPFKRVILAFCTARSSDGGAGALYVLLRKFRKGQGKICWERKPADPDLI